MDYATLRFESTQGIATVTLNRPDQLNAIRVGMYEEITEAILHAGLEQGHRRHRADGSRRKGLLRRRRFVGRQVRAARPW